MNVTTAFVRPCLLFVLISQTATIHAVEILSFNGVAFVDAAGDRYASADDVRLVIDYEGGDYRLSGFGLNGELVRPYFTSIVPFTRRLIFRSVDPKSKLRPELIVDRGGWAHLRTQRLRAGKLNLAGRHRLEPGFRRQSFESNTLRVPVTFDNPVARTWRACGRMLAAKRGTTRR